MTRKPMLLVIDDEPGFVALVGRIVQPLGFETMLHTSARDALASLEHQAADVALVDLRMPDLGGLDVLRAIRAAQPQCQVILMTGHASLDSAVEAVKLGALDYLSKPLDVDRLRQLLEAAREDIERRAALLVAETETARRMGLCGMIGRSGVMQELFALVRRIAPHARIALVTGETGAGKEGIARAIHELGPRRGRRFLTINCSAVVETLFESELFGHMRGAFTGATDNKAGLFEAADGGTLFLDEVGELPLTVQAKLLRVLETGEVQRVGSLQAKKVDVRIVAATNRSLLEEANAGGFRSDLYYRLNVVELRVPSLRERREDIPYLTASFVGELAGRFGKPLERVSPGAERLLMMRDWPGNVRELRNVIERACMLAEGTVLTEKDIASALPPIEWPAAALTGARVSLVRTRLPAPESDRLDVMEREHILEVLAKAGGNKSAAARALGVSRRSFYRRLERYGLAADDEPPSNGVE